MRFNQKCRVYLQDNRMLYGMFVEWTDKKDLASKKMVRFVSCKYFDEWEAKPHVMHTRVFLISNIKITTYYEGVN